MVIDTQNNNRNTALPVVVFTLLGLLIACYVNGWAFGFSIVLGAGSREPHIYAAYNILCIALLGECIVAVNVLACCFKEKLLNKAAACGLILAGATNLATAFDLMYTFGIYYEHKVPLSTWILSSLPCLFWIIAGLLILKLPGNKVDDTPTSTAELATDEAFLTELVADDSKFTAVGLFT
jgi:hypothetical protein